MGAQFCSIYLFHFSSCFGHSHDHHQEKITVSMRHWYLSLCMGGVWSADQTPPIQSDKYQCRIDTLIFSWWWSCECPKHEEKWNKYVKHNSAPSWIYLRNYTEMHGQQNVKNLRNFLKYGIHSGYSKKRFCSWISGIEKELRSQLEFCVFRFSVNITPC